MHYCLSCGLRNICYTLCLCMPCVHQISIAFILLLSSVLYTHASVLYVGLLAK